MDLPSCISFSFFINYRVLLQQCDYVHTVVSLRVCFNRFCYNTSVNWHIFAFIVINIVLMIRRASCFF